MPNGDDTADWDYENYPPHWQDLQDNDNDTYIQHFIVPYTERYEITDYEEINMGNSVITKLDVVLYGFEAYYSNLGLRQNTVNLGEWLGDWDETERLRTDPGDPSKIWKIFENLYM